MLSNLRNWLIKGSWWSSWQNNQSTIFIHDMLIGLHRLSPKKPSFNASGQHRTIKFINFTQFLESLAFFVLF